MLSRPIGFNQVSLLLFCCYCCCCCFYYCCTWATLVNCNHVGQSSTNPTAPHDSQLLDCNSKTTTLTAAAAVEATATSKPDIGRGANTTNRQKLPCKFANQTSSLSSNTPFIQQISTNPSQGQEEYSNAEEVAAAAAAAAATKLSRKTLTTTTTNGSSSISIEFNNIVRRQVDQNNNCSAAEYLDTANSGASGSTQSLDFICFPKVNSTSPSQHLNRASGRAQLPNGKQIEVYIVATSDQRLDDSNESTANNWRNIQLGSTNIVQCRLNITATEQSRDHLRPNYELKFKLRWLRSIVGSQGFKNQSISLNESNSSSSSDGGATREGLTEQQQQQQVIISTGNKRTWTVQREGGLDLFLNDFKPTDSGDYFCQAVLIDTPPVANGTSSSSETGTSNNVTMTILDEKRIHLTAVPADESSSSSSGSSSGSKGGSGSNQIGLDEADVSNNSDTNLYSQENLRKLLPSLHVVPEYSEVALGATIQLACITSELDPDPEAALIEWTYEPFERPGFRRPMEGQGQPSQTWSTTLGNGQQQQQQQHLPADTTQAGNVLIIWSMSYDTVGIYKCTVHLKDFNLTSEAYGELMLRPAMDSAPIVYITPELLRLSANGSATIQCESTGYPPPQIDWYRVEVPLATSNVANGNSKLLNSLDRSKGTHAKAASSGNNSYNGHNGTLLPGTSLEGLAGLELKYLGSRDAMSHCEQMGCLAIRRQDNRLNHYQGKAQAGSHQQQQQQQQQPFITSLSLIDIKQARAQHQGQYVCMATNKHGQNQASTIVDVEFKEKPRVRVLEEFSQQTIVLADQHDDGDVSSLQPKTTMYNVTFKCSIEAGQPQPRLKWLRTAPSSGANGARSSSAAWPGKNHHRSMPPLVASNGGTVGATEAEVAPALSLVDNLDSYDLARASSATSKVSINYENQGKVLALHLSTISIDDEGDYVCLGENELGRHSAVARLTVIKPAQVRVLQASPRIFKPNESFQLDCLASGHPAPLDIEWSRSDRGAFFALISRGPGTGGTSAGQRQQQHQEQERAVLKFDRVTRDDAGEYTCAARDPLRSSIILRDTIMLLYEDETEITSAGGVGGGGGVGGALESSRGNDSFASNNSTHLAAMQRQLPKLLIRPTKIVAELGSNITLDCLAISGLQPTIVEWLAPATAMQVQDDNQQQQQRQRYNQIAGDGTGNGSKESILIRPYYRSRASSMSLLAAAADYEAAAATGSGGGSSSPSSGVTRRSMLQFGSKLRIFNVSKAHEGVYQCKGRNKVGVENVPALVRVVDGRSSLQLASGALSTGQQVLNNFDTTKADGGAYLGNSSGTVSEAGQQQQQNKFLSAQHAATKTKIATMGSNIELRCQVNGIEEQPATSWSRDGRELPANSVQIDHNLWLQNLTKADEGLYVCSARSSEPNRVIQAQINLLVRASNLLVSQQFNANTKYDPATLSAKIVASKSSVNIGDSITLECIIDYIKKPQLQLRNHSAQQQLVGEEEAEEGAANYALSSPDLDELERQVIWTNLHSGHSLFQDNVYIQNNLLIIYDLKPENSATYRCNYNELSQNVDYKLQVAGGETSTVAASAFAAPDSMSSIASTGTGNSSHLDTINWQQQQRSAQLAIGQHRVKHVRLPIGARLVLHCSPEVAEHHANYSKYFWTRGHGGSGSGSSSVLPRLPVSNTTGRQQQQRRQWRYRVGRENEPLVVDSIDTGDADLYQCNRRVASSASGGGVDSEYGNTTEAHSIGYRISDQYLVRVHIVSAKFSQRPVSFVSLPALSDAYHQLELEMKFYPEHEHGLLLFSGGLLNNNGASGGGGGGTSDSSLAQVATSSATNQSAPKMSTYGPTAVSSLLTSGSDYISLGLKGGHLEFKFELGDGTTLLRSLAPLTLNQWHRVLIERNRRGAIMWLDGLAPISNTSAGKFFNLNLDSLLYVGGHQIFLTLNSNRSKQMVAPGAAPPHPETTSNSLAPQVSSARSKLIASAAAAHASSKQQVRTFYGFAHGFLGCVSSLRFNRHELDLMARNRSVSMGIFECDKAECDATTAPAAAAAAAAASSSGQFCLQPSGQCQVDRSNWSVRRSLELSGERDKQQLVAIKRRQSMASADLRCICLLPYQGSACNETMSPAQQASFYNFVERSPSLPPPPPVAGQSVSTKASSGRDFTSNNNCDSNSITLLGTKRCNSTGTGQCQLLSSSTFRCHCKLNYAGELCDQLVTFTNETAVWFNQQAFVQFAFNSAADVVKSIKPTQSSNNQEQQQQPFIATFNETEYARLTSFTDHLNVSLKIQTRSSYGLLFYTGQSSQPLSSAATTATSSEDQRQPRASSVGSSSNSNSNNSGQQDAANRAHQSRYQLPQQQQQQQQVSKSVAANLLARLSSSGGGGAGSRAGADYLAISLVDGHVELSYELGSGVAIVRSTRRINDGFWHKIEVFRSGKLSSLILDSINKYEGQSPGKLFALNAPADIYLGGLPVLHRQHAPSNGLLLSTFAGHLANVYINSLGPINLIRNDHLTQLRFNRNLLPWREAEQLGASAPPPPSSEANHTDNGDDESAKSSASQLAWSQQQQQQQQQQVLSKVTLTSSSASTSTSTTTTAATLSTTRRPTRPTSSPESESDDPDELARA